MWVLICRSVHGLSLQDLWCLSRDQGQSRTCAERLCAVQFSRVGALVAVSACLGKLSLRDKTQSGCCVLRTEFFFFFSTFWWLSCLWLSWGECIVTLFFFFLLFKIAKTSTKPIYASAPEFPFFYVCFILGARGVQHRCTVAANIHQQILFSCPLPFLKWFWCFDSLLFFFFFFFF